MISFVVWLFGVPGGLLLWAQILNGFENQGQARNPRLCEINVTFVAEGISPARPTGPPLHRVSFDIRPGTYKPLPPSHSPASHQRRNGDDYKQRLTVAEAVDHRPILRAG